MRYQIIESERKYDDALRQCSYRRSIVKQLDGLYAMVQTLDRDKIEGLNKDLKGVQEKVVDATVRFTAAINTIEANVSIIAEVVGVGENGLREDGVQQLYMGARSCTRILELKFEYQGYDDDADLTKLKLAAEGTAASADTVLKADYVLPFISRAYRIQSIDWTERVVSVFGQINDIDRRDGLSCSFVFTSDVVIKDKVNRIEIFAAESDQDSIDKMETPGYTGPIPIFLPKASVRSDFMAPLTVTLYDVNLRRGLEMLSTGTNGKKKNPNSVSTTTMDSYVWTNPGSGYLQIVNFTFHILQDKSGWFLP